MQIVRPNLELVVELYGSLVGDYAFMLKQIETDRKWIKFSPRLHELAVRLNFENYPELYQDENRILSAGLRAIYEDDNKIRKFVEELNTKPIEVQLTEINNFVREIPELGKNIDENLLHLDDLDWSADGQAKAKIAWDKLTPEEQNKTSRLWQYGWMFILSSFYNYIAIMIHGRKLTQLVREAITGNDNSFCLAVHIDKNILERIPYFKERHQRAFNECDQDFLETVSRWRNKPQLTGKIRHRLLYMLFALLEGTKWLNDLKHRQILDICDQLNLDRYEHRIETENALSKRLIEYRKLQTFNNKSMP